MKKATDSETKATSIATDDAFSYVLAEHKGERVILIRFRNKKELNEQIRSLVGARWSRTHGSWYVKDNDHYRERFKLPPRHAHARSLPTLSEANAQALQRFIETIRLKGYSPNTEKTYRNEFRQLLATLGKHDVNILTPERIRSYMLYCATDLALSEAQLHSRLNAIKFYFEQVLNQPKIVAEIPRPKKHSTLPKHISPRDVKRLFEVTTNLKHNTMLKLCYGMGLRVSEIVNVKIEHVDSGNMQVLIHKAKGKKDRYANLPESLLTQLREYFKEYRPKEYLFEGQYGGRYSSRSAQQVFKNALKKAGINKKVGIHGLRHSYATHLLESGTDVAHIQKLLGHADIKTTLLYAQVTDRDTKKVRSPLDSL